MAALNGLLLLLTLGLATTLLASWTANAEIGLLHQVHAPGVVQLIVGFLILDLWAYLCHRANHAFPVLWRFHRLHHSDREMDCTTSARGELAIAATTRLPFIFLFGLGPLSIVVHETVLVAVSQFHHSNITLGKWDRRLRWLVATPAVHHIHHSRQLPATNSNYASVLSIWDRLGKSFRRPDKSTIQFGLDEFADTHWHNLAGMLKMPFVRDSTIALQRDADATARCNRAADINPTECNHVRTKTVN